jgi:hypothetical protein
LLTRHGFLKLMLQGIVAGAALVGYPIAEPMATPRITRYAPRWPSGSAHGRRSSKSSSDSTSGRVASSLLTKSQNPNVRHPRPCAEDLQVKKV